VKYKSILRKSKK